MLNLLVKLLKTKGLMFFIPFIFTSDLRDLNSNKHLAQASCTELTLKEAKSQNVYNIYTNLL